MVEISAIKRQIWESEPHFGEVRSDTRPWLMARWKAHVRLSIALIELFSLSIRVPELRGEIAEMCTAWLFTQGSTSLHRTFVWTGSSPIKNSWHQKLKKVAQLWQKDRASLINDVRWWVNLRLNYRLKGYFSRHCDMTQFTLSLRIIW